MITACAYCDVVLKVDLKYYPDCVSHGICIDCMPKNLRKSSLSEEEIEEIVKEYIKKEVQNAENQ